MGGARLSTRTRSPPTASTSDFKSVEVVTTASVPPPHAGAAVSKTSVRTTSTRYFLATNTFLGTMQCTPFLTSTTWVTRQSATMDARE